MIEIRATETTLSLGPTVCTIGFFDGVHQGHAYLLKHVKALAKAQGCRSLVVSFRNHPKEVILPGTRVSLLTTPEEKLAAMQQTGVDACCLLEFTADMQALTAREFIAQYLHQRFNVKTLVMGYDHHFGHPSDDTPTTLRAFANSLNMEIVTLDEHMAENAAHISSSEIRKHLAAGRVAEVQPLLGRPYAITGTVVQGRHIGRTIGFPTANISLNDERKLLPPPACYAAMADIAGKSYPTMLYIGARPTFTDSTRPSIEAHIIGQDVDLYGQTLTLHFVDHLRNERRFDSPEALAQQLQADRARAEQIVNRFLLKQSSNPKTT